MGTTKSSSKAKASKRRLVHTGAGFLDVPDLDMFGIAPGGEFDAAADVAERLLADPTVHVDDITTGGTDA